VPFGLIEQLVRGLVRLSKFTGGGEINESGRLRLPGCLPQADDGGNLILIFPNEAVVHEIGRRSGAGELGTAVPDSVYDVVRRSGDLGRACAAPRR
jgi:hypothetical protein